MAGTANRMPNVKEFDQTKGAAPNPQKQEIEELSDAARAKNAKKDKAAANKSNTDPAIKKRHWDITGRLAIELKVLSEKAKSKRGELRAAYGQAKDEGVNIEAMKRLRKFNDMDIHELDEEFRDMAELAGLTESPIMHTSFMKMLTDADKENPYTLGYSAGLSAGEYNPPYLQGTEYFVKYERGYKDGQKKVTDGFLKKHGKKEDSKVPSERKSGATRKKKS